jgi:hypothetical protein
VFSLFGFCRESVAETVEKIRETRGGIIPGTPFDYFFFGEDVSSGIVGYS